MKPITLSSIVCLASALALQQTSAQTPQWTQFEMNQADEEGRFLWTEAKNWNRGLPHAEVSVEIGDDSSGKALHCVIPAGADVACVQFELAEHARTQGTTLRLEKGASFEVHGAATLSKDRESWFYVDGHFRCIEKRRGLRVGGPWGKPGNGEPSRCHLIIGPHGVVEAWHIGVNTGWRASASPSSPWGEKYWSGATGSEIVVNGGKLIAHEGLRMSTVDAKKPGSLVLKGQATLKMKSDSDMGLQIWCGVWQIDGGQASIQVGDIELHGNKFVTAVNGRTQKAVGPGVTTLKLSGEGISTIRARKLDFVDAAELDVSKLKVPAGEYKVFDGESIEGENLKLASGTDPQRWTLRFDRDAGDVLLEFQP
jgi:hypothetical protein